MRLREVENELDAVLSRWDVYRQLNKGVRARGMRGRERFLRRRRENERSDFRTSQVSPRPICHETSIKLSQGLERRTTISRGMSAWRRDWVAKVFFFDSSSRGTPRWSTPRWLARL